MAKTTARYMLSAAALGSLIVCLMMAGCTGGNGTVSGPSSVVREESASDEEVPDGPNYFADVTVSSGIDFTYRNGEEADHYTILESLGGGVALIDYDRDGLLDVFLTGGGSFGGESRKEIHGLPCCLYKNLGDF